MKPLVLIASDHAGFELKNLLQKQLQDFEWQDLGPASHSRVDYPDFAERVAEKISRGEANRGVLICGSGIGMCIAANKFPGIRAAMVQDVVAARLSREHNDANILCLGARFMAVEYAAEVARTWLNTPGPAAKPGDDRHLARIKKIHELEKRNS